MKVSISGIGPDKKRTVVSWVDGEVEADEFLGVVYKSLAKDMRGKMLFHAPTAISPHKENSLSLSAFFYISRFILKDVKIVAGSIRRTDFVPEGSKA